MDIREMIREVIDDIDQMDVDEKKQEIERKIDKIIKDLNLERITKITPPEIKKDKTSFFWKGRVYAKLSRNNLLRMGTLGDIPHEIKGDKIHYKYDNEIEIILHF